MRSYNIISERIRSNKSRSNRIRSGKITKYIERVMGIIISMGIVIGLATGCGSSGTAAKEKAAVGSDAGTSDSSGNGPTPLRFGVMTGNIDHQITAVGIEKGFFKENGIDLTYTEYAAGINTVDALETDQVDVGIAADFAILNRIGNSNGSDLKILANYGNVALSQLYIDPAKITKLEDLKDKNFIVLPGTIWEYWTILAIEKGGLDKGQVNIVNVDSVPSAVAVAQKGDGDAFWASGDAAKKLADIGWKPLISISDIDATTSLFFIARDSYAKSNPEILKKFYKAFQETIDYITANPDESADIIEKKTGIIKDNVLLGIKSYDLGVSFKKNIYDYLDKENTWLSENNIYSNKFKTADYIDVSALKELYPDKVEIE
ncbi:MAG: ABC transporter substrate-binding protein [Lachnospiraceae bacterium]|nr:ABC transporter substrate-binding protein [Lachnospiraceae bacterium]